MCLDLSIDQLMIKTNTFHMHAIIPSPLRFVNIGTILESMWIKWEFKIHLLTTQVIN